jgi:hypothetical protein
MAKAGLSTRTDILPSSLSAAYISLKTRTGCGFAKTIPKWNVFPKSGINSSRFEKPSPESWQANAIMILQFMFIFYKRMHEERIANGWKGLTLPSHLSERVSIIAGPRCAPASSGWTITPSKSVAAYSRP